VRPGELRALWRTATAQLPSAQGFVVLVGLLIVWQLVVRGPSAYFPAPYEWWKAAVVLSGSGQLLAACVATITTFFEGVALATAVGVGLGLVIGRSRNLERALGPLLEFLRAIPPPVTVPIAVLLLGYHGTMKLTIVALSAIWPILLNTSSATARVEPLLLDVARTFRLSTAEGMWHIIIPSAIPSILLGIRVALPLAIVVTLLVEMLTSLPGIGALMIQSERNFQSAQVYALLVMVGLFGFVVNDLFAVIEAIILRRWPPKSGLRLV
jgi:ABC-type nitrate/sulfonate/bicarbonate transport system permease component